MSERGEHVVVLTFENRSSDHLLGHLSHRPLQPVDSGRLLPSHVDVSVDPGLTLDDLQQGLVELKRLLDEHRASLRATPRVAGRLRASSHSA